MSEDWAAVAKAINERVKELGWRQRELAERSQVSSAIVREIQRNTVNRKRSPRTLESLSITLGWHPQHLEAVLHGRQPPGLEVSTERDLSTRLEAMERRLDAIEKQLSNVQAGLATLIEHIKPSRSPQEP
ncbi:XRE family transcriptional regulator [Prauserella endophytica]|uniref:XRE family transcriptional regulator n=1 Tax=Prauserella endophytica TaxID=1592324 RepID=A0ABY2S1G8_9PSEU|nr:XRE family transcriptional regulator [Prauserella endophytica]TKG68341.1 XRE family transcriptional regulator [Prauserella endophytica]